MKTRALLVRSLLATVLVIGLTIPAFSAGQAESETMETYTIRLGLANEATHYHALAADRFGELVEERTDGAVTVQVFPAQQLGTEPEMISQTSQGIIEMFFASPGHVGGYVREYQILLAPYIWRDFDHLQKTMEGPIGEELAEKMLDSHGIRVLDTMIVNGHRHLSTRDTPVSGPADLRGVKIRAPQAPIYLAAVRSLGADPVPVDFAELYMALQQGVAEGQENALGTMDSIKLYEVQQYVILTEHIYQTQIAGINERFFSSLPEDYQSAILESMADARDYNNQLQLEADEESLEKFRGLGLTIIEPDVEAFRQNSAQYVPELEELWGPGLYDRIVNVR